MNDRCSSCPLMRGFVWCVNPLSRDNICGGYNYRDWCLPVIKLRQYLPIANICHKALKLYHSPDVRWDVKEVNGLINWWSDMSWVGVRATSNITSQWWQNVILNFHFLIVRHWWSSQYSCRPLRFPLICKAMDNIVQSCHSDGKYISTPKSWWGCKSNCTKDMVG